MARSTNLDHLSFGVGCSYLSNFLGAGGRVGPPPPLILCGVTWRSSHVSLSCPLVSPSSVPEIIDPVFAKTSQNARFLLSENERFGLVFVKTGSINSGTGPKGHSVRLQFQI
jgi:hypothetical protein